MTETSPFASRQEITPEQRDAQLALTQQYLTVVRKNCLRPFEESIELELLSPDQSELIVLELDGSETPPYLLTKQPLGEHSTTQLEWKIYELRVDIWRVKFCKGHAELLRRRDDPGEPLSAADSYALAEELLLAQVTA